MALIDGIKAAVNKAYCGMLAAGDGAAGLMVKAGLDLSTIQERLDEARALNCNTSLSSLPEEGSPPSFTGGQCDGTWYQITTNVLRAGKPNYEGSFSSADGVNFIGAIQSITPTSVGSMWAFTVVHKNGTGTVAPLPLSALPDGLSPTEASQGFTLSPINGLDNCGDPPGAAPPSLDEVEILEDVEYEDDNGNPELIPNVPVKFFPPCVSLFDGVRIPFELQIPIPGTDRVVKVCGKVGVAPDLGGTDIIQPNIDIDLCPDQIPGLEQAAAEQKKQFFSLDERVEIGAPGLDTTFRGSNAVELKEGDQILAVFIQSNQKGTPPQRATEVIKEDYETFPSLLVPRIGHVRFKVAAEQESDVTYGYTNSIPIQCVDAYIQCPAPQGAVAVEVRYEDGWQGSYQAARRKSCCDGCKEEDPRNGTDQINRCNID